MQRLHMRALIGLVVLCSGLTVLTAAYPPRALNDAQILGIYIQVNSFDIETALLARSLSHALAVRRLAAQVSADHIGVRQTAFKLAETCKVSPILPSERDAAAIEHGQTMTTLMALEGAAFDRAYIKHDAAFHQAAIDAVKQLLQPAASCPDLQAHFKEILPALQHHLSETQVLARDVIGR